ncbi:efflux transporter outer membrane subunit [Maribacter sp. MAR_2009_72]|uniref:efflux transporter outer membrane subunit n=1 Tax=Maribacter sp. MAR_2009_72 TaxID=1250050 RepID=UPI00119A99E3|nr:efflux transporter outer membrane subunit [Maribacter sp. MAR_2009_72]TVZ16961.1 NodT family efflux transporter outer membrane factor (OMF) lipoprotein [Maribacter sp. MAR_2009_72]
MQRYKKKKSVLVSILIVTIFGCSPKMNNVTLPIADITAFSNTGNNALEDKWWTTFNDNTLNTLIDSALRSNYDLEATWQQFLAAKATVSRTTSDKWPQINASAQTAENFPINDFTGGENTQLGITAAYEIDLWGRIRSAVQAEKYRAEASLFDYRTAAITLSAEIASTWYQLVAARKQLEITENQIATNEDIIKLIRSRFVGGQVRAVDILRQVQLLESTKEQKIIFSTNVQLLENQLAVLLGRQPQENLELQNANLPNLPELPSSGLPLELVRRRPDLQRSYANLLAADRDMASAVKNRYPRLSLNARGQLRANNFQTLFDNWAYSIAGNLFAPLINGGALKAEAKRRSAIKEQRLYEFGQTTLVAFQEVEDGLVQNQMQKQRTENIARQLELAEKSNNQLRVEFLNGFSPYLDVLIGLDQEQQLRRDYVAAQLRQIQARIGLYRALAGSFETDRNIEN